MSGCSSASIRCPAADALAVAEFGRWTPPPEGPLTRQQVDELRESEIRKNAAGRRLIEEYEKCRAAPSAPATTAKVS